MALFWHFHQPYYRNPFTSRFELPWTRVHALKDYLGMGQILEKFSRLKLNFNFVPSLLLQIEEYLQGDRDYFQELFQKNSSDLSDDEKYFVVRHFFAANLEHHIKPYSRYHELYSKKMAHIQPDGRERWGRIFSVEEIRDICCWFQLTNIDHYYKKNDGRVAELLRKGSFFTEEDKQVLAEVETEILAAIVPLYRKLWHGGRAEIATSPFYHPILPLLVNPQYGRTANPGLPAYDLEFSWPEDMREQLVRGLDFAEKTFGKRPAGVWPSEGSLSPEVIAELDSLGVLWAAGDERILERSLQRTIQRDKQGTVQNPQLLYKPYRYRDFRTALFFRDQQLSDLIGFTYQQLPPAEAARDLFQKLLAVESGAERVISIILDGENAWEFFPESGREFLETFYGLLEESDELETALFSELVPESPSRIESLAPGSWINANFDIWIGDEEDRKGWKALQEVRAMVMEKRETLPPGIFAEAYRHILIAEGSDWFWWYGKENFTPDLETFDLLFRSNLQKALNLLQLPVEGFLVNPIYQENRLPRIQVEMPRSLLEVRIDGDRSSYLEWLECGRVHVNFYGGAMHLANPFIHAIRFGFDEQRVLFRFDTKKSARNYLESGMRFNLALSSGERSLEVRLPEKGRGAGIEAAAATIIEIAVARELLDLSEGSGFSFHFYWEHEGLHFQRFPSHGGISLQVPPRAYYDQFWQV